MGETVTFRLERLQTHKQCVLPLENTVIQVTGGEVTDPGTWKKGIPEVLVFRVTFSEPGQSVVRIERNCPKEGLIFTEARGVVAPKSTVNNTGNSAPKTEPQLREQKTPSPPQEGSPSTGTENIEGVFSSTPSSPPPAPVFPQSAQTDQNFGGERGVSPSEVAQLQPKDGKDTRKEFPYTKNLLLWSFFFLVGALLYLSKQKQAQRPFLFLSLLLTGFFLGGCPEPMGAVYFLIARKETMLGIAAFLFVVPLVLTLVWGRFFCGWICPAGAVQEFVHLEKIGVRLPVRSDRVLKRFKAILLIIAGYFTWRTGVNIWGHYEPFKALFNFQGEPLVLFFLGITLLSSLFVERPFCRYVCPLGAILATVARFSSQKIKADESLCTGCGLCAKISCPTGALFSPEHKHAPPQIDETECIRCLRCVDACRWGVLKSMPKNQHKRTPRRTL